MSMESGQVELAKSPPEHATIPAVGQVWPEQGGIYIGSRLIDGQPHHIIIPGGIEHDIENVAFANVDARVGAVGELNGHADWRVPGLEDLILAWINAREHFVQEGVDGIYWGRTEHLGRSWVVSFVDGYVDGYVDDYFNQCNEFRVRPFRSFIALSI